MEKKEAQKVLNHGEWSALSGLILKNYLRGFSRLNKLPLTQDFKIFFLIGSKVDRILYWKKKLWCRLWDVFRLETHDAVRLDLPQSLLRHHN